MYQRNVDGKVPIFEEQGEFGEHHRSEVRSSLVDCFTYIGADKHGIDAQVPFHLRGDIVSRADRQRVTNFNVT